MSNQIHSSGGRTGGLTLSPRLAFLAGWVPQGARLADIGTDHAYLPVWLDVHGRVNKAIAADLRPRAASAGQGDRQTLWSLSCGLPTL